MPAAHLSMAVQNSQEIISIETISKPQLFLTCISETVFILLHTHFPKLLLQIHRRHLYGSAWLTLIPGKLRHRIVERLKIINTTIYMCTLYTNDSTFVCAYLIRIWEFLLYFYSTLLRPLQIVSFASICAYEHTFECRQTKSRKHRLNRNKSRKTYINTQIRRTLLSCTKNIRTNGRVLHILCNFCCFDCKTLYDIRLTFVVYIFLKLFVMSTMVFAFISFAFVRGWSLFVSRSTQNQPVCID